jgi:hypothetical protein
MDEHHRDILVAEDIVFNAIIEDNLNLLNWLSKSSFQADLFSSDSIYSMACSPKQLKWVYRKRPDLFVPDVLDETIFWAKTYGDVGEKSVRWLEQRQL